MKKLPLLIGLLVLSHQQLYAMAGTDNAPINVVKASSKIVIDGVANDLDWSKARSYPLSYVYNALKPTDKQASNVKMLWDDSHVYFFFQAKDQFLTARETQRDGVPFYDDCFEIFLMPTSSPMELHYGFEVNLNKTANDFIFLNDFYQDSFVSLKSYNPEYEVEAVIEGTLNDNSDVDVGWSMELAIPIKVFHTVSQFTPLQQGSVWNLMIVRQDRNDTSGERTSTSTLLPLTEKIDVHDPKVFGQIKFITN